MDNPPILVFDVSSVCWAAVYVFGRNKFIEVENAALFGLLRKAVSLMGLFETNRIAWAFDRGHSKRSEIYPQYKRNRNQQLDEEKAELKKLVNRQINEIRTRHLPEIGFVNILEDEGYEADDCIASFVECCTRDSGDIIIVSSDEDLFQLLSKKVMIYRSTDRMMTYKKFVDEYKIDPFLWSDCKALAGCPGDNVEGIRGVGIKRAIDYIAGRMNPNTKMYKIITENGDIWRRNLSLVRLPFPGVKKFYLEEDRVDSESWSAFCRKLGFPSLERGYWEVQRVR